MRRTKLCLMERNKVLHTCQALLTRNLAMIVLKLPTQPPVRALCELLPSFYDPLPIIPKPNCLANIVVLMHTSVAANAWVSVQTN